MRKHTSGLPVLILLLIFIISLYSGSLAEGVTAGSKVTFGRYPQHLASGNVPADPEPVSWLVLAVSGDQALLLAEQPLVGMPFNDADHFLYEVTWETCTLRAWLNGEFLNDAFSPEERQAIPATRISTPDYVSRGFVVSGGNDTTDQVFLLSAEELEQYLATDEFRVCCPTEYAVYTGASKSWYIVESDASYENHENQTDICIWWLRSPGEIGHYTAVCSLDGDVSRQYSGDPAVSVRPAIWVRTSALTGQ